MLLFYLPRLWYLYGGLDAIAEWIEMSIVGSGLFYAGIVYVVYLCVAVPLVGLLYLVRLPFVEASHRNDVWRYIFNIYEALYKDEFDD